MTYRSSRLRWIICYAICLHAIWGVMILWKDGVVSTITPLFGIIQFPGSHHLKAIALLGSAIAATWGLVRYRTGSIGSLCYFLPQQALLVCTSLGSVHLACAGHYADGVIRSWAFILADQLPNILVMVFYTAAVMELHAKGAWTALGLHWQRSSSVPQR